MVKKGFFASIAILFVFAFLHRAPSVSGHDLPNYKVVYLTAIEDATIKRLMVRDRSNAHPALVDNNYGSTDELNLTLEKEGYPHTGDNRLTEKFVLKFELSAIPPGADIKIASLKLKLVNRTFSQAPFDTQMTVYRITQHWRERTVTWRNVYYDWEHPYASTPIRRILTSAYDSELFYTWDITELVKEWIRYRDNVGRARSPNYGILIDFDINDSSIRTFRYEGYTSRIKYPFYSRERRGLLSVTRQVHYRAFPPQLTVGFEPETKPTMTPTPQPTLAISSPTGTTEPSISPTATASSKFKYFNVLKNVKGTATRKYVKESLFEILVKWHKKTFNR